jgi:NTE family protein
VNPMNFTSRFTARCSLLAVILALATPSFSQRAVIRNLAFEGGGIRGIAYAGVVEEFEKSGVLPEVRSVAGTSAGALIALTISLGYESSEIRTVVEGTNFSDFNDGYMFFVGGLNRMTKHYGWYRGNKVDEWLGKLIVAKKLSAEITFKEFHDQGYRDIFVTGTSLNRQKTLIFSYKTYPTMKIRDAVRISMSIPLYFEATFIDAEGKVISDPGSREDLDLVVDGGILGNFPIAVFDSVFKAPDGVHVRIPNKKTVGIRLDTDSQIERDLAGGELAPLKINDLASYIGAFYILINESLNRIQLIPDDWKRTISVSTVNIGPRIKKLSSEQKERLINSGRMSTRRFLKETK